MKDFRISLDDALKLSSSEIENLLKGERDTISKNYIAKHYRELRDCEGLIGTPMQEAYSTYYHSDLWKDCIRPLLLVWGIKNKKFTFWEDSIKYGYDSYRCVCPICIDLITINQMSPHHKEYPPLAKKWNYKGFDGRVRLNDPRKIEFKCIKCHGRKHNG